LPPTERITSLFFEPARVFQNLRYHPHWLSAFLVIALFTTAYQIAFIQRVGPETIAAATIDKTIESGFIQPDKAPAIRQQQIEAAKSPFSRITGPLNQIGGMFIFMLIIAGLYTVGVLVFGGRLNYWQSLAVVVHAALPAAIISSILSLILLYIKSVDDIDPLKGQRGLERADLSILFSSAEHPYLYTIGTFIGILTLYRLWLTATGLHNTSERLSTANAWVIALLLLGLGLVLALIAAALFPAFVS
jgi:hypothetical protein